MGRLPAPASAPSECASAKHHFDAPHLWVMSPLGRRLHEALEQDDAALHWSRSAVEPAPPQAPADPREAPHRRGRCCTGDNYDVQSRLTHKMQKPCGCKCYDPVILVPASIFGGPHEFERVFLEAAKKLLRDAKLPSNFPLRSLEAVAEVAAEQPRGLDLAFIVSVRLLPRVRDVNLTKRGGAASMQRLEYEANALLLPPLLRLVEELRALRIDRCVEDERLLREKSEQRAGALAHHRRQTIRDALQDPFRELFDRDEHHCAVAEGFGQPRILCRCSHPEHGHERTWMLQKPPTEQRPVSPCEDMDCSNVWAMQRHSLPRPASTPAMETVTLSAGRLQRPAGRTLRRPGTSNGDARDDRDSFASQMPFLRKKGKSKPVPASKASMLGASAETTPSIRTFRDLHAPFENLEASIRTFRDFHLQVQANDFMC